MKTNQQIRLRSGGLSLRLGTFTSSGVTVNSSLEFNLANELRRFLEKAGKPENICLQITAGETILSEEFPEPDGLDWVDAIDLMASREKVKITLSNLMSSDLPRWVGEGQLEEAKLKLVELIAAYGQQIENIRLRNSDAGHVETGDVRSS